MGEVRAEKPEPEKALFTIRELCAYLGLCYRSVHRAVRDGRIQSIRCGGAVRIPSTELQRLLTKGF